MTAPKVLLCWVCPCAYAKRLYSSCPPSSNYGPNLGGGSSLLGDSDLALTEAVLELASHLRHGSHAASAGGLTADGLGAPVVFADASRGVAARRAIALLDVHGAAAAATAQGVRLVAALTKGSGTLSGLTHLD